MWLDSILRATETVNHPKEKRNARKMDVPLEREKPIISITTPVLFLIAGISMESGIDKCNGIEVLNPTPLSFLTVSPNRFKRVAG